MPKAPYQPRKRPQQDRSRITRDAILEATAHILAEEGYSALTTNVIAERAGVSIGSLYQYFPNKEAIVASLIQEHVESDREYVEALFDEATDEPMDQTVRRLIGAVMDRCESDLVLAVALRKQIPRVEWTEKMRESTSYLEDALYALLHDRYPDADRQALQKTAFIIVQSVDGIVTSALFDHPKWLSDAQFREMVSSLVLESIPGDSFSH